MFAFSEQKGRNTLVRPGILINELEYASFIVCYFPFLEKLSKSRKWRQSQQSNGTTFDGYAVMCGRIEIL